MRNNLSERDERGYTIDDPAERDKIVVHNVLFLRAHGESARTVEAMLGVPPSRQDEILKEERKNAEPRGSDV